MTKLTREDVIKSITDGNKDFKGWDLSGLDLSGLDFESAFLGGANLKDAYLRGTTGCITSLLFPFLVPEKEGLSPKVSFLRINAIWFLDANSSFPILIE